MFLFFPVGAVIDAPVLDGTTTARLSPVAALGAAAISSVAGIVVRLCWSESESAEITPKIRENAK